MTYVAQKTIFWRSSVGRSVSVVGIFGNRRLLWLCPINMETVLSQRYLWRWKGAVMMRQK